MLLLATGLVGCKRDAVGNGKKDVGAHPDVLVAADTRPDIRPDTRSNSDSKGPVDKSPDVRLDMGKDAPADTSPDKANPDVLPKKDKTVDTSTDLKTPVDLPKVKDLNLNADVMPCYGLTGYDNTCYHPKTYHQCCRDPYGSGPNVCPPEYVCGHVDCFLGDMGAKYKPCPVGSYCVSPSSCSCTPSKGGCNSCDDCKKTCNLIPKCK